MVFLHVICLKWTKHGLKRTKKGTNGSKFAKKKSVSSGFGWYPPLKKKSVKLYVKGSLNFMIHLCVFRGLQVSSAWNKITFFSLLLCTELSLDGQMMILTKTFISTASCKKLCWGDIFLNASGRCYRINTKIIF